MSTERHLRSRTVLDYSAMHNGRKSERNSDKPVEKSPAHMNVSGLKDIDSELKALEVREQTLRLELALEEKKREVEQLQNKLLSKSSSVPQSPATSNSEAAEKVTLKELSRNKELDSALSFLKQSHLDFLRTEDQTSPKENPGKCSSMAYVITDFVSKPTGNSASDKAKKIEDVTAAQWVSANARILQKLIAEGLEMDGVQQYLRYTEKIGDYLQMAETSSVMLLDHAHRNHVHDHARAWDNIDSDKVYFHLKATASQPRPKFKQATDERGKPICIRYNKGSCYMTYCKYAHVCFLCKGDHPKIHHGAPQNHASASTDHAQAAQPTMPPPPPRFRHF